MLHVYGQPEHSAAVAEKLLLRHGHYRVLQPVDIAM